MTPVLEFLNVSRSYKKGVPVLVLDGTAHNDPATEEQKMRLRAFLEMML